MKTKKFALTIKSEERIDLYIADIIYMGLQFYDDLQWENFNVEEVDNED